MNWEAIAAISEALGAVAVLLTLGYLAVQVRHARDEMARSTRQARADAMRQVWLAQAGSPELAAGFAKLFSHHGVTLGPFQATAGAAGLSDVEARQVYASLWASWTHYEQVIESLDQLTKGARHQFNQTLRFSFGTTGPSESWYRTTRSRLNPTAVRYVDELLARPE